MITLIAAVDKNSAIGKGNAMPWHLPADFTHFKETTMGHPVIMGRNTYLSIGRPLPGRTNIVVSKSAGVIEGCVVAHSIEEAFVEAVTHDTEVYIIGGASIYEQLLSLANRLVITYVDTKVEGADTFFPKIDTAVWKEVSREKRAADEKNVFNMEFVTYERA